MPISEIDFRIIALNKKTYVETVDWLFRQLPFYQNQGAKAFKKDLTNILKLNTHLKNPHKNFESIHVAGTNGKGSTSHIICSILIEAGYKVGLYTSPHLIDFRERIKVNGKMISEEYVVDFAHSNHLFIEVNSFSFFELSVGMAFSYFSDTNVDIAVIETGLGGRLDSTNVVSPLVSVITNIGLDHQAFLGNSIPEIAFEKAGIIKKNTPVVLGEYKDNTYPVFKKIASEKNASLHLAEKSPIGYSTDLNGCFQQKNIETALKTIEIMSKYKKIGMEAIENGLKNIVKNTGLSGRWQVLKRKPLTICDIGHNVHAFKKITSQPEIQKAKKIHFVLGFVEGKNIESILKLLPSNAQFYFCSPKIQRAIKIENLKKMIKHLGLNSNFYFNVFEAFTHAQSEAEDEDLVFLGGSTFVVSEILQKIG